MTYKLVILLVLSLLLENALYISSSEIVNMVSPSKLTQKASIRLPYDSSLVLSEPYKRNRSNLNMDKNNENDFKIPTIKDDLEGFLRLDDTEINTNILNDKFMIDGSATVEGSTTTEEIITSSSLITTLSSAMTETTSDEGITSTASTTTSTTSAATSSTTSTTTEISTTSSTTVTTFTTTRTSFIPANLTQEIVVSFQIPINNCTIYVNAIIEFLNKSILNFTIKGNPLSQCTQRMDNININITMELPDNNLTTVRDAYSALQNVSKNLNVSYSAGNPCTGEPFDSSSSEANDSCFVINACGFCGPRENPRGRCVASDGGDKCRCFQLPSDASIIYRGDFCYAEPFVSEKPEKSSSTAAIVIAAVLAPIAAFGVLIITMLSLKSYRARKGNLPSTLKETIYTRRDPEDSESESERYVPASLANHQSVSPRTSKEISPEAASVNDQSSPVSSIKSRSSLRPSVEKLSQAPPIVNQYDIPAATVDDSFFRNLDDKLRRSDITKEPQRESQISDYQPNETTRSDYETDDAYDPINELDQIFLDGFEETASYSEDGEQRNTPLFEIMNHSMDSSAIKDSYT